MDAQTVSALADRYGEDVMRFCRRLSVSPTDAEDLYQQTFLKLMGLRVRLEEEQNPRAYLFSLANGIWKNECRKRMRRAAIAPSVSLDAGAVGQESAEDTQGQVEKALCHQALARAVQQLEPKFRTPILLRYSFGMEISEIARIEHLPQGTVKSRMNRAKRKLRREMEALGYGTESSSR